MNYSILTSKYESFNSINELSTTSFESTTKEVFSGRWEVFNDPLLDPRLIPDDPVEREGLRTVLLNSNWFDNNGITQPKLDYQKLQTYYYTEHKQKDGFLLLCGGATVGSWIFFTCWNMTKEQIDKFDDYGTLKFIMESNKAAFYSDIVILPIICLLGVTGIKSPLFLNE